MCKLHSKWEVERAYNDLSRLTIETTSIKPDGSGFTNSWDYPIKVEYEYNTGGSTTQTQVKKSSTVELDIDRTFDARNLAEQAAMPKALRRCGATAPAANTIDVAYFDVSSHQIADYDYTGPWRVRKKTLGEAYTGSANFENGTYLSTAYDGLRRTSEYV